MTLVSTIGVCAGYSESSCHKHISALPTVFRFAQYPDGSKRLQGGHPWTQGFMAGIDWVDLPLVKVNEQGEAIE